MAYEAFYIITDWQNLPSQRTALNRKNLLNMENGIKEVDTRIVQLDASKLSMEIANTLVKSVNVDAKTGVITVTKLGGGIDTYDLDIERVVTNFDVTDEGIIILTLADGTEKQVDIGKFINTFKSSATVAFSMTNREVTATIIDGSVTMDKLAPSIQSEFRQYMLDAQNARDAALQYQKFTKRYTIGDVEFEGSETDNAKYYYEGTKQAAAETVTNATAASQAAGTATEQAGIATKRPQMQLRVPIVHRQTRRRQRRKLALLRIRLQKLHRRQRTLRKAQTLPEKKPEKHLAVQLIQNDMLLEALQMETLKITQNIIVSKPKTTLN